jgi:hypothetical protein
MAGKARHSSRSSIRPTQASVAILERLGLQGAGLIAVSGKSGRRYILAPIG